MRLGPELLVALAARTLILWTEEGGAQRGIAPAKRDFGWGFRV